MVELLLRRLASLVKSRRRLQAENLVLRRDLNILRWRAPHRLRQSNADRLVSVWLYRLCPAVELSVDAVRSVGPGVNTTRWISERGVEYPQGDIDATLQLIERNTPLPAGTKQVMMTDDDGHGTHVAGIAAGNGHPAGNCRGDGVYAGVAPAANLLVVKRAGVQEIGEDTGLVNALAWIWNHLAARNRGVVVNMSFDDSRGPHNGTSLVEAD
jgi:hypothetical protein